MEKINNYQKISHLLEQIEVEKAYPFSIIEGFQSGEVYVDDQDNPSMALLWHYNGFANIAGKYDAAGIHVVREMMHDPSRWGFKAMSLQTQRDSRLEEMFLSDSSVIKRERYIFELADENRAVPEAADCQLEKITAENYDLLYGRIIPAFSWESMERFLCSGYGYCLIKEGRFAACAFSAGVSEDYVDIGVETAEEYRGKGYGKIVASAMVKETLKRKKRPMWGCDVMNEGSMRLACSIGFQVCGTHPWFKV